MRQASGETRNRGLAMLAGGLLGLLLALMGGAAHAATDAAAWAFDLLARVEQWRPTGPLDFLPNAAKDHPLPTVAQARIQAGYGRLPMHFEPNLGQTADEVKFVARGPGYTLFLTADEAVLALRPSRPAPNRADPRHQRRPFDLAAMAHDETPPIPGAVIRTRLEGATRNPEPQPEGLEKLPGISNYFLGNDPAKWRTNVPHYQRVRYPNVYPGIDLVYYGNPQRLEHDFIVAPGADPAAIQLAISGAERATVNAEGDLVLKVPGGEVVQQAPKIYQVIDGQQQVVAGRYVLRDAVPGAPPTASVATAEPTASPLQVGFVVAQYNREQPLVIDPVLVYSTYLGGSNSDGGLGIAVDGSGNAYVTGATSSTDFPKVNAKYPSLWGSSDAFIFKLSGDGQTVRYSTYLGGSSEESGSSIAVDGSGNAYVTGRTFSTDFPKMNAIYPNLWGPSDAFVFKLSGNGQTVLYSTYLGGANHDNGNSIAVDGSGNAYVTGATSSTDFPKVNAKYPNLWGSQDAFVFKLSGNGQTVLYSTYLGGSSTDGGNGIAVDGSGNAYVTGATSSTDFPKVNAKYPNLWGSQDAFVFKLSSNGQTVLYSTYLGGSSDLEGSNAIAVDGSGNAYVTGWTYSTDFPVVNAIYPLREEVFNDAFVLKLSSNGQTVFYSTYLGGSGEDVGNGIAVDRSGNAYVTGVSYYISGFSYSSEFPTINAIYPNRRGPGGEAFIAKISDSGGGVPTLKLDVLDGQDFRSGANISTDPYLLGDLGRNKGMVGTATDGEARLVLRARTNQPGSVTFSIPAGDGELIHYQGTSSGSSVTVQTVPVGGEHMAFATYRATEQFPRAGHSEDEGVARRQTTLSLNASGGVTLSRILILERPPVVLIHGLFSSSDTWQPFAEKLKSRISGIEPDLFYGDYRYNNAAPFSTNKLIPPAAVIAARNNYRNRGLAVVQADVFGHSMGGILGRIWAGDGQYRKDKNYRAGDFNKLIAVDSPHTGSPWANLGWSAWNDAGVRDAFATLLGTPTDLGALEDLRTGTDNPALVAMNGQSPDVPGHVILGNYVPTVDDLADLSCLAIIGSKEPRIVAFCQAWKLFKFFGYDTSISLHFPVGSDLIVSAPSQRDGFGASSSRVSEYSHIHMKFADRPAALETDEVVNRAVELLNTSPDDNEFGQFGNGYAQASTMKLSQSLTHPPIRVAAAGTGIQITSPADGSTVAPGQTVAVTVQPDAGLTLDSLALIVPGDIQQRTAAPWTFSVAIPASAVGPFGMAAAGKGNGGTFYIAEIAVNVAPTVVLRALATTPADVLLAEAGGQQSLVVQGYYEDGSVRDLTAAATGTTYQSSNTGVVAMDANGRLTARSNGTATITATHGGASAYTTVRVAAETDLAITQTDSPDPIGADGRITYALIVRNQGTQRALDVQVYDTLPAGATLVAAAGADWSCIEADGIATCSRDALDAGATATIDLSVAVPLPCGVVTNQATVNAGTLDENVDDNISVATTSCAASTWALSVAKAGTGSGTVTSNPAGIDCGASCSASFDSSVSVTLTPIPTTGSTFAGWSGACTGTGACQVTMDAAKAVTAAFTASSSSTILITDYYQSILNRAPDPGGLAFWQGEVARLQGLGVDVQEAFRVMAGWFFTSAEYLGRNTSDAQYVTDLYRTFFQRTPDGGGLNFWTGQLAAGMPRAVVLYSFLFSAEFGSYMQGLLGNTASRGEVYTVVDFYRGFLNRLPDTDGFTYWLGRFRAAQCQGAAAVNAEADSISTQFLGSAEYASRNRSDRDYVGDLYYAFLRRGSELSGFDFWVNQLSSGLRTREQLRQEFLKSPEFQGRVSQIINQGCFN